MPSPLVVPTKPPLSSQFEHDEDLAELIPLFIEDLESRVQEIHDAYAAEDLESVRCAAHKVRGSAGGYGFPDLTDIAGQVEDSIRSGSNVADVTSDLAELLGLCMAAINGRADS